MPLPGQHCNDFIRTFLLSFYCCYCYILFLNELWVSSRLYTSLFFPPCPLSSRSCYIHWTPQPSPINTPFPSSPVFTSQCVLRSVMVVFFFTDGFDKKKWLKWQKKSKYWRELYVRSNCTSSCFFWCWCVCEDKTTTLMFMLESFQMDKIEMNKRMSHFPASNPVQTCVFSISLSEKHNFMWIFLPQSCLVISWSTDNSSQLSHLVHRHRLEFQKPWVNSIRQLIVNLHVILVW